MINPYRKAPVLTLAPERGTSRPAVATKTQTTPVLLFSPTAIERAASRDGSRSSSCAIAGSEWRCQDTPRGTFRAFTLIELLVVVSVVALCAATLLPALAHAKAPAQRVYCANNLKGIGEAFRIWGQDHGDAFPMRVAVKDGGYRDFIGQRITSPVSPDNTGRGVFGIFRCLSNELSTPNALFCPAENEIRLAGRMPATTFASVISPGSSGVPFTNDLNVSYFVGVDAGVANPRSFVAGDHNLGSDGQLIPLKGFVTAPFQLSPDFKVSLGTNFVTNAGVGWLNTMHSNQGNVALADGSVSQFNRVQLQAALRNSGVSTSVGFSPNFPNPIGCSGLGVNRIQFP
jgi:prepilin-type N-terminal cleavage/methylation domain-containing protein/prepilin-type processing-associated H-X9-DG protein